tara:strand:+ start:355 stop:840 length:486 start_codon:yes stop_codon:yes gene_type:complete
MITLGFNGNLNSSIDIGDSVYYVVTTTIGANTSNSTEFTVGQVANDDLGFGSAIPDDWALLGTVSSIQTNDYLSQFYTTDTLYVIDDTNIAPGVIVGTVINVQEGDELITPPSGSFIFFSKDNKYNMSSLAGYYGEVKFKNNSYERAELYATSCEVVESSK